MGGEVKKKGEGLFVPLLDFQKELKIIFSSGGRLR